MKGKTWLFWGGLIATAGGILFQTSYEVQELEEKLAATNRKIVQEQESIQVLKAEWSFLNDPTRLEQLARAHLALQPVEARQFASLDIIPMRPAPPPAPEAAPAPSFPPTNPGGVPMVRAPQPGVMPAVAGLSPAGRVPIPPTTAGKLDRAGIVPVSAPVAAPLPAAQPTNRPQPAPAKPAAVTPATAKVLPVPAAPVSAPSTAPAGKLPANAPLPALNRPTDIAAAPIKAGSGLPAGVKPTDSLGLLVARLGANR